MTEEEETLREMIDTLRAMRENTRPHDNSNPVYHRYSNAISSINYVIEHGDCR